MDTSKIIKGVVNLGRYTVTAPIVKEDYGLYLQIEGVELPSTYEVDFSNSEHNGTSVTMIGNSDGVLIPHQFIDTGKDIFAFLYHVGANYGRTVYKFRIPNKVRPDRTNEEPTPEEQSVIDQAISALNEAVAQTAQDVIDADASAQNASADAERAEEARTDAQNFATQAEQSATDAQISAQASANSATASAQSASEAQTASTNAETYALNSGNKAVESAQSASASANSASQAQGFAQSASASASSAQGYASQAQTSAQTASNKASEASQSASQASGYAQTAETAKTDAQTAKTQAETARDNAVTAKTAAETAQGKAEDAQAAAEAVAESIPSDYSQLSEDVSDLKSGFNELPKIAIPEETEADLYISDTNGNVLAEFADGHIRTKNFDSSDIEADADVYTAPSDSDADADISDLNGNVLVRLKDGNLYTKNFDSTLIRNLTKKKWVCLGDSLTEHNQRTTLNYHDYIAQETGITVHNLGHSGCGYAKIGGNGQNFVNQADNIPDDASVITVFGSGNDGSASLDIGTPTDSGTTTLCGYMNAVFDKIYEEHPTTPLGVITPTPWANKEPSDSNKWMENYSNALVAICSLRGIPCLDLYHCSNLHPTDVNFRPLAYSKDDGNGVHPDETGHALIAPRIRQFLFSLI